jgi:beta-lactamase regulating signal transducer with metallopeptidase domain
METLLRIGLSNAVVALLMALVVVTVACVWRRPAVLHALWLLVLVKLVTPPLMWVRVPWPVIADPAQVAVSPMPEPSPVEPPLEENAVFVSDSEAMRETSSVEISVESTASGGRKPPDSSSSPRLDDKSGGLRPPFAKEIETLPIPGWIAATCAVWLAGALAWYVLALFRLRRFRRMLRHAAPAPESLRQRTQRLAEKLRLRRCPGVWLVPGRVAPMLWAAGGRPRILFPADLLKQVGVEQQNALLVHELAHLRRRDHWVRWLEFTAAGLYWWNPVLWFARRELREAEEQCCDAWVTSTLPGAGKTYATALLETLDFLSDAPPATPLLASGVGRVVDLKRRLTMIMRGTTPRTLGWRGAMAVVGLGALLLPLLPAWVQAQPAKVEAKEVQLKGDVKVETDALAGEAEKDGVELTKLRAELAQKQAEVAALTTRIAAITANAKKRQTDVAVKTQAGGVVTGRHNPSVILKIAVARDAKATEIIEKVKRIEADGQAPSGADIIFLDKDSGKILWTAVTGALPEPTAVDTDKRIIELEMKLKSILNEVEQLRRERTPPTPKSGGESKPHSYGPTPLEQVPYVNQLFKQAGPDSADEVSAAFSTADKYFNQGKYETALKCYDRIAPDDKGEIGVKALGGSVRCLAALGRKEELNKRVKEIRGRLELLPVAAQQQWKVWLAAIDRPFKQVGPETTQDHQAREEYGGREEIVRENMRRQIVEQVAERDAALRKKLDQLQEQLNTANAHNISLTAERDILQAKLKEAAHQWERERAKAEAAETKAETALSEVETNADAIKARGGNVNQWKSRVDALQREVDNAKVNLEKRLIEHQQSQEKLIREAAATEAQLRDSGTNLSHLEQAIRKMKNALGVGDVPTKP